MSFLKYLTGGVIFVLFSIGYQIFRGENVTLNQSTIVPLAISTLLALLAFAIADYIFKGKA
jgi:hypothetical protein